MEQQKICTQYTGVINRLWITLVQKNIPVHARRGSAAPQPGGSPFFCTLFMVQPSRVSDTPFPGGEFRRLRAAGTVSKRIDTPYGGFYPLGTPSSALLGKPRSDGTQAFLLRGGTEKRNGSTVTNPQARLNADHSFHSCAQAVNGLRQYLRKIRAICRDNSATMRKTSADTRSYMRVTYEVGP